MKSRLRVVTVGKGSEGSDERVLELGKFMLEGRKGRRMTGRASALSGCISNNYTMRKQK